MKYCFYSRKNGYPSGDPAKYFFSQEINDSDNLSKDFIDLSGSEIIKKIEHEYFPFVKIIDVKVDTNLLKKDVYLCDTIHQISKGNEVQAQIIYQNLVNYSNLFK